MKSIKILTVLIAALFSVATVSAQSTANTKPTIIFVHGIWADGSSWAAEFSELQAKGYNVILVQNPLTSLAEDVASTQRAIDQAPGKVILVGHSWGGFVITQAGNDPKVTGLVYVAGFAPDAGETIPTLSANGSATELSKYFVATGGYLYLSEEGIKKVFAPDLGEREQDFIFASQVPASQAILADKLTDPAWKTKASWFIISKNDKTISPDLERFMAKRMNAKTTEIESGHLSLISHSKEVVAVIEAAANSKQ
ncbi:alpha/beta hydrolase [Mucilaginibacter sp.]|jgi:pimeloyl-ACP methyl ester carboxylesterase|uniref:alpha/beta hydrolase n=1 Tax=Mucilaginibacter sp. TaxID=1882438 RepID=UPI0035614A31